MKKILVLFTLLIVVFTPVLANAQVQNLGMISSKDALRTYALEQAVNVDVGASTHITGGSHKRVRLSSPTARGIEETIRSTQLALQVVNPDDWIWLYASVVNFEGEQLFYGYTHFVLESKNGMYILPKGYGDMKVRLSDNIPIRYDDAEWAQVNVLAENGSTQYSMTLSVQGGKIYFPTHLAGTSAIVQVSTSSSGMHYWGTEDGRRLHSGKYDLSINAMVDGVVTVEDENFNLEIETHGGVGQNVTVEFVSTEKSIFHAAFHTSEGKWFKSVLVRKAGTSNWVRYPVRVTPEWTFANIGMQAGVYYLIPEWEEEDLRENPYYPGGKG